MYLDSAFLPLRYRHLRPNRLPLYRCPVSRRRRNQRVGHRQDGINDAYRGRRLQLPSATPKEGPSFYPWSVSSISPREEQFWR